MFNIKSKILLEILQTLYPRFLSRLDALSTALWDCTLFDFFTDPKDARDVMFRDLSDAVLPLFILNEAGYIS